MVNEVWHMNEADTKQLKALEMTWLMSLSIHVCPGETILKEFEGKNMNLAQRRVRNGVHLITWFLGHA